MSALDPRTVQQLAADLPRGVFLDIVLTYRDDLARLSEALCQAVVTAQPEALRQAAHALAGTASSIGALTLEALARAAMLHAIPSSLSPDTGLVPSIDIATRETLAALDSLAARLRQA